MKVKIGKYKSWFGPYQLAELLCFWVKETPDKYGVLSKPHWVHDFGEWLAYGSVKPEPTVGESIRMGDERSPTWLYKLLTWFSNQTEREVKIQIDPWDTWSMYSTLAPIILPMLKQLRDTGHGSASVDDEDVPDHLKSTSAPAKENEWDTDANHHKRWEWVMNEMIFAFEKICDEDWENEFYSGNHDIQWLKLENGNFQMTHGPDDTFKIDYDGLNKMHARIQNGTTLFGKYFQSLWD